MPSLRRDDTINTRVEASWKFPDSPVLRDKPRIACRKGSDRKQSSSTMIYKENFPTTETCCLRSSFYLQWISYLSFFTNYSRPLLGYAITKKVLHTSRNDDYCEPNSSVLTLSSFRPNGRNRANWASGRARQPPTSSSPLAPLNFLLRLAHPVRNNENPNQLLDSNPPALRQILQLEENPPI